MDEQTLLKARRHLSRKDAILKPVIRTVGPCTLRRSTDYFATLVRSIISQQISTKAAIAIGGKLLSAVERFEPQRLLDATEDTLRSQGLSGGKQRSIRDLAAKCTDGTIPLKKIARMDDDNVVEALTQVHGIGPWTAHMFLIFSLGRLDVLPVGDYGLRAGAQKHYALAELPKRDALESLAEPWKPYRTVGTWYIWRSLGGVPQSD